MMVGGQNCNKIATLPLIAQHLPRRSEFKVCHHQTLLETKDAARTAAEPAYSTDPFYLSFSVDLEKYRLRLVGQRTDIRRAQAVGLID